MKKLSLFSLPLLALMVGNAHAGVYVTDQLTDCVQSCAAVQVTDDGNGNAFITTVVRDNVGEVQTKNSHLVASDAVADYFELRTIPRVSTNPVHKPSRFSYARDASASIVTLRSASTCKTYDAELAWRVNLTNGAQFVYDRPVVNIEESDTPNCTPGSLQTDGPASDSAFTFRSPSETQTFYYDESFIVPEGLESINVTSSGGSGWLYITVHNADYSTLCRGNMRDAGTNQTCRIMNPPAGNYKVSPWSVGGYRDVDIVVDFNQ